LKLGVQIAEAGYYLSIPSAIANTDPNSSFKKLAIALPLDKILTETDSPYMGPLKGVDNTPDTVIESIQTIAQLKKMEPDEIKQIIRNNFRTLFGK
jgi:TatD DNase family protein